MASETTIPSPTNLLVKHLKLAQEDQYEDKQQNHISKYKDHKKICEHDKWLSECQAEQADKEYWLKLELERLWQ